MSEFQLYLQLGFEHISDINGYDHILFLVALCASYLFSQWKQVLILVTAFTIGHSVTLALSTLNVILVPSEIIEFLIPVTIFLTAILNIFQKEGQFSQEKMKRNYALALFFGMIHGMGFSNYLKELLGQEQNIFTPLLAFNVGLELGQILIVAVIMVISYLCVQIFKVPQKWWTIIVSIIVAITAIKLMIDTKFW